MLYAQPLTWPLSKCDLNQVSHCLFLYLTKEKTVVLRSVHDAKDRHSVHCLEDNTCCMASGVPQESSFSALNEVTYEVAFYEFFLSIFCVQCIVFMFCSLITLCTPSPSALSLLLPNSSLHYSFLKQFYAGCLSCCVHGSSHCIMSKRHFIVPHPLKIFLPLLQCSVGLSIGGIDIPFRTQYSEVSPSTEVGLFHYSVGFYFLFLFIL